MNLRLGILHRISRVVILSLSTCAVACSLAIADPHGTAAYEYLSPRPDSRWVSRRNNVILRFGARIEPTSLSVAEITVQGSTSGVHSGTLTLADDQRTVLFLPHTVFNFGETVTVDYRRGIETITGDSLPPVAFSFDISTSGPQTPRFHLEEYGPIVDAPDGMRRPGRVLGATPADTLPGPYPGITVTHSDDPRPGYISLAPWSPGVAAGQLMLVDNHGNPIFYRRHPATVAGDFKVQPSGLLTYFLTTNHFRYYVMDSSYTVVGTVSAGNGYPTDNHELLQLPNGHWLLMVYDSQRVGLDTLVTGGQRNAAVIGLIIQEIDLQGRVVFQWRSWDDMDFTDTLEPLTGSRVDYVHGNAIELDHDGNLLISSRHLSEITKISRTTGRIMWRMGPHAKRNEFTFLDDPSGFSYQHDVRRLPNGNLTIFDNGVLRDPTYSRAVEYEIDEPNRTARLVWQYRTVPDTYGRIMGSVRRDEAGATLINWGGNPGDPETLTHDVTELHPGGSVALDMKFPTNMWSYRAYRSDWRTNQLVAESETVEFGTVPPGTEQTRQLWIRNDSNIEVTVNGFASTDSTFALLGALPVTLRHGERQAFSVTFRPGELGAYDATVYVRAVNDTQLVARDVVVRGEGGYSPASNVRPIHLLARQPNPFTDYTTVRFNVLRRGHVVLRVFDATGRGVATLADGVLGPGMYTRTWYRGSADPGVYFLRLESDGTSEARKVVLLE